MSMLNELLVIMNDMANKLDKISEVESADRVTLAMVKLSEYEDHEVDMAKNDLATAMRAIEDLMKALPKDEMNLPAWWQVKLSRACMMIDGLSDYFKSKKEVTASDKNKGKRLNKPFRTPGGPKKFSVYVKNEKGNVIKVNFGSPDMEIKRDDPNRRKNFRARHNCDNPGPKTKARYWSCKNWEAGKSVTDVLKGK